MRLRIGLFSIVLVAFALLSQLGLGGCGSGGGSGGGSGTTHTLTLSPAGPTIVHKGEAVTFTASLDGTALTAGVTFSVVGGDSNGTIGTDGVYTPPATIPTASPEITVQADAEGLTATADVELRTSETIAFGSALQVSDTPTEIGFVEIDLAYGAVNNRLNVALGSLHVNSIWAKGTVVPPTKMDSGYSLSVDLGEFAAESIPTSPLTVTAGSLAIPYSVETDSDLNPGILLSKADPVTSETSLLYLRSLDGGTTWETPIAVAPGLTALGKSQIYGSIYKDKSGTFHVLYDQEVTGGVDLYYTQSTDGGATWKTAVPVRADADFSLYPSLAVDDESGRIYACWANLGGGAKADIVVATSSDGGATFGDLVNISNTPAVDELYCRIAVGPTGQVHVVTSDLKGDVEILFAKSTDHGTSFSAPKTINSDTSNRQAVAYMSVDPDGRIDVIWTSDTNGSGPSEDLMWSRSTDEGETFSPNTRIAGGITAPAEGFALGMGLAHDAAGRLHVQYATDEDTPGVSYQVYYMKAE